MTESRGGLVVIGGVALLLVGGLYVLFGGGISSVRHTAPPPPPFAPTLLSASSTPPTLSAEAYTAVYVGPEGVRTALVSKNEHVALPIASITKLMTAYVASESLAADTVTVPKEATTGKGRTGWYKAGMQFPLSAAYAALLVPSNNEMAETLALASADSFETFVARMNVYAARLMLAETVYVNTSGLDPYDISSPVNQSSAYDISRLLERIRKEKPALFDTTRLKSYALIDAHGTLVSSLTATNELLEETIGHFRVIGGKTGETPRAKQALTTASEAPCGGMVYAVVLRSDNRFADTRALLQYVSDAFTWSCTEPENTEG